MDLSARAANERPHSLTYLAKGFALAMLLLAVTTTLYDAAAQGPLIDDSYISLRYARNFAEGHGLVYNIGERVEGYTNLAWTLMLALAMRCGFSGEAAARVLDTSFAIAALGVTWTFARHQVAQHRAWAPGLALVAVIAGPCMAAWTMAGLGEMLYVTAVGLAMFAAAFLSPFSTLIAAIFATLVRPEGMLVAACALGVRWLANPNERAALLRCALGYAGFLSALTLWRLGYYGLPLPNTFYAKVGGIPVERGLGYLEGFLRAGGGPLLLAAAPALLLDRRLWPTAVYCLATAAFVVRVGGDVFPFYRFLLPTLVLLAASAARSISMFSQSQEQQSEDGWSKPRLFWSTAGLLAAIALAFTMRPNPFASPNVPWYALRATTLADVREGSAALHRDNRKRAEALNRALGEEVEDATVAAAVIGALGWHGRFRILDILGLTDATIARHVGAIPEKALLLPGHQRSFPDYVLSQAPSFIAIDRYPNRPNKVPALMDLGMHPEFRSRYVWDASVSAHRRRPKTRVIQRPFKTVSGQTPAKDSGDAEP